MAPGRRRAWWATTTNGIFDRSYAIYTGGSNHWNQGVFHVNLDDPEVAAQVKAGIIPKEPFYEDGQEVERPIGICSDDLYTSKMLEYLEQGRKSGEPFFAYLAYTTAHAPLQAPDFLIDKYVEHYLEPGYEGLKRARFESQKVHGTIPKDAPYPSTAENDLLRPWSELSDAEKRREARMMATYSAMMESQDYHIGMLLNYLHETGQRDDTLVIYMSDNGPEGLSDHGELSSPRIRQMDGGRASVRTTPTSAVAMRLPSSAPIGHPPPRAACNGGEVVHR